MRKLVCALIVLAFALSGCSGSRQLSSAEQERLDSLDATGVVRAYFASGDQATELHLSTPEERERRGSPNYQPDTERRGGVSDLVVGGGGLVADPVRSASGYTEQRQHTVSYISSRGSSVGGPPGKRFYFVYTGRSPEDGTWKVIGVGTGP